MIPCSGPVALSPFDPGFRGGVILGTKKRGVLSSYGPESLILRVGELNLEGKAGVQGLISWFRSRSAGEDVLPGERF